MRLRVRAVPIGAALALALVFPVGLAAAPAGAVTAPTVAAPSAPAAPISFAEGDDHPIIAKVQRRLGVLPATGYFGPRTRAAVEALQERAGLPVTGILDNATLRASRDPALRPTLESGSADAGSGVGAAGTPTGTEDPAVPPSPSAPAEPPAGGSDAADAAEDGTEALRQEIIAVAASLRGIPYVAGGTTPRTGFDCSGYSSYVYRKAIGMILPRVSRDQYAFADPISRSEARPGDLVFMYDGGYIHHVAIYAGDGMVWHSPRTGGVVSKVPIWTSSVYFATVLGQ